MMIDETGGSHGVRDSHAILSLEHSPRQKVFGKTLYPSVYQKAAVYARAIIMEHPFIDGNKRTGISAASIFLENNGYQLIAKEGELESFALRIVDQKYGIAEIAGWFRKNSRRNKK